MTWLNRKATRKHHLARSNKLTVEELEPRLTTGNLWSPFTPIDIQGIAVTTPDVNPEIVVAGTVLEFSIVGTGKDYDLKMNPQSGTQDVVEDAVNISWCMNGGTQTGTHGSFQLGSAGNPGEFDIEMNADDLGVVPAGDFGSRNDTALHFTTHVKAIWVDIGLKYQGILDGDDQNQLHFPNSPPPQDRELGSSLTINGAGLYLKVELTGTVTPAVPDGTSVFDWKQTMDARHCYHALDGTVDGLGTFKTEADESPHPTMQTNTTLNSKVFMIDAPGWLFQNLRSPANYDQVIGYWNFSTRVTFDGKPASHKFQWHMSIGLRSDGTAWQVGMSWMTPATPGVDLVHPPSGIPPVQTGNFFVDCSSQTW